MRLLAAILVSAAATACGEADPAPAVESQGGAGGIEPIEPDAGPLLSSCAPGEREVAGACQAAGVPADGCGHGFGWSDGGCVPILPATDCAAGTMALPAETSCREVAPCATGTWGGIPTEVGTVYVDASYPGIGDGSATMPFVTIQEGIDAAADGAIVAVAAGVYVEALQIAKPMRLWGKCPAEVAIEGPEGMDAVTVSTGGVELHDIAVTGGEVGVRNDDGDVVADRVWIHDNAAQGAISAGANATFELRDSLVEKTVIHGLLTDADLTVARSVVRDVAPDAAGDLGVLVATGPGSWTSQPTLDIHGSLIERGSTAGVSVIGYQAEITDTLIRSIAPANGAFGHAALAVPYGAFVPALSLRGVVAEDLVRVGVIALVSDVVVERSTIRRVAGSLDQFGIPIGTTAYGPLPGVKGTLRVSDSLLSDGSYAGLSAAATDVDLVGVWVRDIAPSMTGTDGVGIEILPLDPAVRPVATILGSRVDRTARFGVGIMGSDADIELTAVRDVAAESTGVLGRGFSFEPDLISGQRADVRVRHSLVERVTEVGVAVIGADVLMESVEVRDVQPRPLDGQAGRGAIVQQAIGTSLPATATFRRCLFAELHEVGISAGAATVTIEASIVRDIAPRPVDGKLGDAISGFYLPDHDPTLMFVDRAVVAGAARAGISIFGASLELRGSWLDCNLIHLNVEPFQGRESAITDAGDNHCGCAEETVDCKSLSATLEPPGTL